MHKHRHLGKKKKKAHIQGILDEGKNGFVIWVQWSDFSFGEDECIRA